jgi:ABC-type nickel/cobalt efflux system permease component RcnA
MINHSLNRCSYDDIAPPSSFTIGAHSAAEVAMNATTPALIAAAAGVGLGHAIMPDHWVPLAVIGRTRRWPLARVARLSGLAGIAHVLVSVLLGAVIIIVGLEFRSTIQHAQDTIVGLVLIATGLGFTVLELTGRGHAHDHDGHHHDGHDGHHHDDHHHDGHHHHGHDDDGHHHDGDRRPTAGEGGGRLHGVAAVMVPFGAAASPDLTILPVFLAAAAVGAGTAVGSLLVFALVTVGTIIALTLLATFGGYQVRANWLDRWGNTITAATLLALGTLVLTGAI